MLTIEAMSENPSSGYFEAYEEYSRTLRTWFVAYGIGAPVFLLSNERLWIRLSDSRSALFSCGLFLLGVIVQTGLASLNKCAMWALYYGEENPTFQLRRRYKLADWFSEQFWFDFLCDSLTALFLGLATLIIAREIFIH